MINETNAHDTSPGETSGSNRAGPALDKRLGPNDRRRSGFSLTPGLVIFAILFYFGLAALGASFFEGMRGFLKDHAVGIVIALAATCTLVLVPKVRESLKRASLTTHVALTVFAVIPVLVALVFAIVLLTPPYDLIATRVIFFVLVTLFPAVMFYIFITSRKDIMVNDYVSSLVRLGLLAERRVWRPAQTDSTTTDGHAFGEYVSEGGSARDVRVVGLVEKFEAEFGRLTLDTVEELLTVLGLGERAREALRERAVNDRLPGLLNGGTLLPIVGCTLLVALGWLMTLPPLPSASAMNDVASFSTALLEPEPAPQPAWAPFAGPGLRPAAVTLGAAQVSPGMAEWMLAGLLPERTPVLFAFLGAYFFSIQLLFRRYVRRDLSPTAYTGVALRIVLAVIGTWVALPMLEALGLDLSLDTQLAVGFVIGVFPSVLWQVMSTFTARLAGTLFKVRSMDARLPLSELDGLTLWHESRLQEEDIENMPNMATADILEMMLHTRLPHGRIIDWVDQAILYTQLGTADGAGTPHEEGARARLRCAGIRTASGLIEAYRRAGESPASRAALEAVLGPGGNGVASTLRTLTEVMEVNPNLKLVMAWRGMPLS